MKRIIFSLIFIVPFFICSCVMGPDDMIKAYNDNLYEDVGDGILYNPNGASVNTKLIPMDVYPAKEHNVKRIEISDAYYDYKWTIRDNKTNITYSIDNGYYIVYVGKPLVDLTLDRDYTLTLFAKNRNGVLFTDTATIKVVK